jgi:DNA polymerase-3 subunit alpha
MLISDEPIYHYSVTELPPKGFYTSQIDMFVAEKIGLFKLDILSQRGLGHIKETLELVRENKQLSINIHDIEKFKTDKKVAAQIRNADTIGCFYIESPDMRQYLHPKMKELLEETYGVMVYQEDVIKVAHHFAGLDMAEADVLRRAMSGKYRGHKQFEQIREKYFRLCKEREYPDEIIMKYGGR